MSLDLTEPDLTLKASVQAEVDSEYPSLTLPGEPTEQEQLDYDERETLRASELSSRYKTQRQSAIDEDRLLLTQDEQDRLAAWDTKPAEHQPTGVWSSLGMREMKLREWVTNEIEAARPKIPVELTPRQFRLAMLQAGVSPAQITAMLEAAGDEAGLIEWEYASSIRRDHPLIVTLAGALGKTEADIDQIFILGGGI
jgi:hypothetical protein